MDRTKLAVAAILLLLFVPAVPAGAQIPRAPASCTASGKNLYVRDVLNEIYLWYTQLPQVNPVSYGTPEEYLEAVRYRPLDEHFSYITSRESNQAFFGESQYVGFGMSTTIIGTELRVLQVFPESPAADAGLARGHRIVTIGGRRVADLIATGAIDGVFGPEQVGFQMDVQFLDSAGGTHTAGMGKRIVTIPTVSLTKVYDVGGRRVGYIFFRNFVSPSIAALDAAFAELAASRPHDLVLDLRYNGGGLVRVAQHLASLIGGTRTRGQVLAEYFHNDKNADLNEILRFDDKPNAANLDRLIVITTPSSASASELIINALRPFIPVVVIGDRTYGKPVGQYQFDFCDKTLAPVSFSLRNANGEGDFFNGFAPDCAAADDIEHELGDASEASLREALVFASTNACSPAAPRMLRFDPNRRRARAQGWQSVVNAY